MKRLIYIGLLAVRALVVGLAILALVASGAGAAQRLFAEQCEPKPVEKPDSPVTFDSKPDPKEATGGMATGSRPWTEQSFWVQANPALPAGSDQLKDRVNPNRVTIEFLSHEPARHHQTICQSPCRLASQIGHRFTLVGSRPSGTS